VETVPKIAKLSIVFGNRNSKPDMEITKFSTFAAAYYYCYYLYI